MALTLGLACALAFAESPVAPTAANYASLQAALEANPGRPVFVPPGDYRLTNALILRAKGSGLYGFGTLIQQNTNAAFLELSSATNITLRDLTLLRPAGREHAAAPALRAERCAELRLENLRVRDNCAGGSAILIPDSTDVIIQGCEVRNYKAVTIDDRTRHADWGYAFRCLNGAGITVRNCQSVQIRNNRLVEDRLGPTRETAERFDLGKVVARAEDARHPEAQADRVGGWHQGSAIEVLGPTATRDVLVANNLITDLGRGLEAWALWQPGPPANSPVGIKIAGMSDGELLRDHLVITGNLIYDSGQDFAARDRPSSAEAKPHFKYAVWIEPETAARLRHVRFTGNLFPAGEHGVSNVDLSRWP